METLDRLIDTRELQAALEDLAKDIERGYKEKLLREDHRATGQLLASIHADVEVGGTTYAVVLHLEDYWKYLEEGTPPHWPPRDAILKWIKAKPVIPRPDEKGRIPTQESLAFLISRAMAGQSPNPQIPGGTKGTHDLRETTDAIIPYWKERLKDILGRMYGNYIASIVSFPLK